MGEITIPLADSFDSQCHLTFVDIATESIPKSGSERCIHYNPDPQIIPPVLEVHIPRKTLRIPTGLSLAPWAFTKTLKPALALLQEIRV